MKLHHRILGEGQPLIIMHGLFGSSDNWQTFGKFWAQRCQVILVDLRNHGHSPHHEDMNYSVMADDLAELVDDLELASPVVLGHSMGGKVALQFANRHPGVAKGLCIGDIGIKGYPPHHQQILAGLMSTNLDLLKSRGAVDQHLQSYIPELSVRQFLMKSLFWVEKGKLAWRFNVPVIDNVIERMTEGLEINTIETPTLFVRGGASSYILDEDISTIESHFEDVTIATLPEVGHWIHAEDPKGFHREFELFFDQLT